ncbi:hypothetical protein ACFL2V_12880 [Pseudomonadota bacterium]
MFSSPCPHCFLGRYGWWPKYRAAKWLTLSCSECGRRACSHPLPLALLYIFYLADVVNFGYLYVLQKDPLYLLAMFLVWIVLDVISLRMPLAAMRSANNISKEERDKQ